MEDKRDREVIMRDKVVKKILIPMMKDGDAVDLSQELKKRKFKVNIETCTPISDEEDDDDEPFARVVVIPKTDDEMNALSDELVNRGYEVEIATYKFIGEF